MRLLPAPDSIPAWRNLLFALTGATILLFLKDAFLLPGTLRYAPFTMQDDARQFLAWMPRIADPALMRGDHLAEYWQSVAPPLYEGLFRAAAAVGLEPTVFARLLPPALLALGAWAAWRAALQLTGRPAAAFVAAATVMALLVHEDSIWSATPRAFSPPFFLLFLDGLLRGRPVQMVAALFVLAAFYPTTALVGLTMLGLSFLRLRPKPGIELSRRSILTVAAATFAVAAPILLYSDNTARWEPVITVEQAKAMPSLGTPDGRSSIVNEDGSVAWLCSQRMAFAPEMVPCWATDAAAPLNLLLLVPLVLLFVRAVRRPPPPGRGPGELVYGWALIAGLAWWAVAFAFAFKLHLPARYPQRVLSILEWLAIGQLLGAWLDARLRTGFRSGGARFGAALLGLLLLVSFLTPTPGLRRPEDPGAIRAIAALPPGTIVAGVTEELDFVPALTGRPTLATTEHAIPYHLGYFAPVRERIEAMLAAAAADDPRALRGLVQSTGADAFVVDRALVEAGRIDPRYARIVPEAAARAERALARRPSLVQRRARACALYAGPELLVLDTACLIASGQNSAPGR